ncbi:MAG TPA: hypothetical protein VI756_09560 [Blastocatellia bacterium]
MNNLAYNSRNPQEVGPKVEELIRKEFGAAGAVPYSVADGEAYTIGAALKTALVGGQLHSLFQLNFELPPPRPGRLEVSMDEMGVGCFAGSTVYSAKLSKPVSSEVSLEGRAGLFGKAKFAGDQAASAKLNANGDLVKLATKVARTESTFGGRKLIRERLFKLVPDGNGCVLIIGSLPRTTSAGFSATVDSKDFFELTALIERAL